MATPSAAMHKDWARVGASLRLQQIREEARAILRAFPELADHRLARSRSATSSATLAGPKKRRTISAAARKRMAAGMRKYWAARKAAEKKAAS